MVPRSNGIQKEGVNLDVSEKSDLYQPSVIILGSMFTATVYGLILHIVAKRRKSTHRTTMLLEDLEAIVFEELPVVDFAVVVNVHVVKQLPLTRFLCRCHIPTGVLSVNFLPKIHESLLTDGDPYGRTTRYTGVLDDLIKLTDFSFITWYAAVETAFWL